jgi:hypothetical protein
MKEKEISFCKNCGDIVEKNFCPNCGQERRDLDVSFKELLSELLHETFNFDSKLLRTIRTLFLKPGYLSLEYLRGKRVKYITPFRLYLIISILFFLLLNFKNFILPDLSKAYQDIKTHGFLPDSTRVKEKFGIAEPEKKSAENQFPLKLKIRNDEINTNIDKNEFLRKVINTFQHSLFFLLPLAALILQFLFFRKRKKYIEHLILMTHLQSAVFVILILNLFLKIPFLNWIFFVFLYYYFIHSLYVFYNQNIGKILLKFQLFLLLYFFTFAVIGILALILPVFVMYYVS